MPRARKVTAPVVPPAALVAAIATHKELVAFTNGVERATPVEAVWINDEWGTDRLVAVSEIDAENDESTTYDLYDLISSETGDNEAATLEEVRVIAARLASPGSLPKSSGTRSIDALDGESHDFRPDAITDALAGPRVAVLVLPWVAGFAPVLALASGDVTAGCESFNISYKDSDDLGSLINDADCDSPFGNAFAAEILLAIVRAKRDAWLAAQPKPKRKRRAAKKATRRR